MTRVTSDPCSGGSPFAGRASRWSASIGADEMACHDVTLLGVAENLALDEAMLI